MKILLNGAAGHMGREVCRILSDDPHGMTLAAAVDRAATAPDMLTSLDEYTGEADVIIDFSHHAATFSILAYATSRKLPVVLCTTGQTEQELAAIYDAAKQIPVFFSANMSLGVAVLVELAKKAVRLFPDADIEIIEKHHNRKLDAPSGTALMIAGAICEERDGAYVHTGRDGQQKREKDEIGIHAVRLGNVVGEHEVIIATPTQTITLKHEAHTRALFADGAVSAAAFLVGQAPGLYAMQDMVKTN